ncbi:hypothetical protein RhiirA4_490112, partial [Rhizophagus irregularis]
VSASVYGRSIDEFRFGFSWIGFGFGIWAFDRRILVVISLDFGYVSAVISPWALDWFPFQIYIE